MLYMLQQGGRNNTFFPFFFKVTCFCWIYCLLCGQTNLCFCQVFRTRLLLQQPKHLDFCLYFHWPGFHFSKFTACELLLENSNVQNIREVLSTAVLLICALSSLLTVSKMWVQQCPEQQLHQPRCARGREGNSSLWALEWEPKEMGQGITTAGKGATALDTQPITGRKGTELGFC